MAAFSWPSARSSRTRAWPSAHGADLRYRQRVLGWSVQGDGVQVATEAGSFDADRLLICAGPWARQLVPSLERWAVPERQVLAWLQPTRPDLFQADAFPVFLLDVEEGSFYGFPIHEVPGFKFGKYHHLREPIDPDDEDRSVQPEDEAVLRSFAERYLPDGAGPTVMLKACIFTNSPDEHFIIDRLPDAPQVIVGSGVQRPRLQVLQRRRGDPRGRPGRGRDDRPRHRALPARALLRPGQTPAADAAGARQRLHPAADRTAGVLHQSAPGRFGGVASRWPRSRRY